MLLKSILFPLSYVLFFPLSVLAGSYMICVNPNDKDDWKWAPPMDEIEHAQWGTGNQFIPINESGTWLNGSLDFNKKAHPVLKTNINEKIFNIERAESFCNALQKHCKKLGDKYSNVFVKGNSIPPFFWGFISFSFYKIEKNQYGEIFSKTLTSTTCKNMFYNYFPNDGGEFHIFKD